MLMYHCDGKGCDFTSMNEDDFTHIVIGSKQGDALIDQVATRDLCPGCVHRLALIILNETVDPANPEAIAKEQIKEPCSGHCGDCHCDRDETDSTEKAIKALKECGEKVAGKLRATQQLAASVVGEHLLNYLMRNSENGMRRVTYYKHLNSKMLAVLSHEYGHDDVRDICTKYAVSSSWLMHPNDAFIEIYKLFKKDVVNTYKEGFSVSEIATDLGVSDKSIINLIRHDCTEPLWRRDVNVDAQCYDSKKNQDVALVLSMYDSGASISAIHEYTGYSTADITCILNSAM